MLQVCISFCSLTKNSLKSSALFNYNHQDKVRQLQQVTKRTKQGINHKNKAKLASNSDLKIYAGLIIKVYLGVPGMQDTNGDFFVSYVTPTNVNALHNTTATSVDYT